MSNEELKKKYYELVELRIDSDEMWQWIEENCLQKQQEDFCIRDGCSNIAQTNYRLCLNHLAEAHAKGFDDSNK